MFAGKSHLAVYQYFSLLQGITSFKMRKQVSKFKRFTCLLKHVGTAFPPYAFKKGNSCKKKTKNEDWKMEKWS